MDNARKRALLFCTVLLWALSLCGCQKTIKNAEVKTEDYSIREENGKYILTLHEKFIMPDHDVHYVPESSWLKFSSFEEMRRQVAAGDFSESEIDLLRPLLGEAGTMELPNVETLVNAVLPSDLETRLITIKSGYYFFEFAKESEEFVCGHLKVLSQAQFQTELDNNYTREAEWPTAEIANRNAFLRVRRGPGDRWYTRLGYTIQTEHRKLYILEKYEGNYREPELFTDDEMSLIPDNIRIFGEDNGNFFFSYVHDLPSRPSIEWLSSFGLTPYVEE